MKRDRPPPIQIQNAQRAITFSMGSLRSFAEIAIALAWAKRCAGADIISAEAVFVSIVGDKRMEQLHERFCGIPGPTDVLTFQHGELVISAQTAALQAARFRTSIDRELQLYILHGLLHLCGYHDRTRRERERMHRFQRALLRQTLKAATGAV
jgi:probable rRNA maturation factor